MARKEQLRRQRSGTVINLTSGKQESDVVKALLRVEKYLGRRFPKKLNVTYLYNEEGGRLNRGSFYFRDTEWSIDEMAKVMKDIAERAILYSFSRYGKRRFVSTG